MTKASDPLSRLARALGRRDESPNVELAVEIAATGDRAAVKTLIEALTSGPKSQHSDCIKVLYEVAERNPKLVAGYCDCFVDWLTSRSNRVAWGAMTALDAIALTVPAEMARRLPEIVAAADGGSVITRDHAVGILVKSAVSRRMRPGAFRCCCGSFQNVPTTSFRCIARWLRTFSGWRR